MKKRIIASSMVMAFLLSSCSAEQQIESESEATTTVTEVTTTTTAETEETTTETTIEETTIATTVEEEPTETLEEEFNYKIYLNDINYSGAVLISTGREIGFTYASGVAMVDPDTLDSVNITNDTVFEMGSITKQFTAVCIMQLYEQGLLSLDDTLDKYIPEYKYADQITIHQLLNMTTGVVDYITGAAIGFDLYGTNVEDFEMPSLLEVQELFNDVCTRATEPLSFEEMLTMIEPYDLHFEPGTAYEYSNTNYYFLGEIIERITGVPYDEYVRTNILEPLELDELWPDIDHLTSDGNFRMFGLVMPVPHQDASISYSVGVMTGTTAGLLKWEYAVLDGALLTKESWDKIFDGGEFGYGYGWTVDGDLISHSGMTLGYNAYVFVNRATEDVVIALSNTQAMDFDSNKPSSAEVGMTLYKNIDKIIR